MCQAEGLPREAAVSARPLPRFGPQSEGHAEHAPRTIPPQPARILHSCISLRSSESSGMSVADDRGGDKGARDVHSPFRGLEPDPGLLRSGSARQAHHDRLESSYLPFPIAMKLHRDFLAGIINNSYCDYGPRRSRLMYPQRKSPWTFPSSLPKSR